MNELTWFGAFWEFANSAPAIAMMAGLLALVVKRLFVNKSGWQKWEGTIIAGIRYAEKAISNNTTNRAAARLDAALQYVLAVRTNQETYTTDTERQELKEGIQIIHTELVEGGTLRPLFSPPELNT